MQMHRLALVVPALVVVTALSACVPNAPSGASGTIAVDIADDRCGVAAETTAAGAVTFALTNSGSDLNEFEILADDKLRIVGEKENLAPGSTTEYTAQLGPGTYYTACKFQLVGAPVGLAEFTVTGTAAPVDADAAAAAERATTNYVAYIRSQVGELQPLVTDLTDAYATGDDERARSLFAAARVPYERIEPTAEAFGDLDPAIDYREVDAVAEGLDWTGFHRIEKDLWEPAPGALNSDGTSAFLDWAPSTPEQRREFADGLVADVQRLADLVRDPAFQVSLDDVSNGAIGLLDEVATGKITGEEDWWSGTDLTDFAANVQGAEVAFGTVEEIASTQDEEGAALAEEIRGRFDDLQAELAQYGSLETGFRPYGEVTEEERRALSDRVNALAEPLSQLTATVLG